MEKKANIISAVVVLTCFGLSSAQAENSLLDMSLEELMDVPIVSASRQSSKASQTGAAVSVITAEQIHNSGLTTIPEILQLAPGVDVRRVTRGRYSVGIRGNFSLSSDRTLVLIDGRTAINPVTAGTSWQNFPVHIEDIERIEIVRGPVGATWGANAANGVINIITKSPEKSQGAFASSTVTEFGDTYNHFRFGGESGLLSYRISVGYESIVDSLEASGGDKRPADPLLVPVIDFAEYSAGDFLRSWRLDSDFVYDYSEDTRLLFGAAHTYTEQGDLDSAGYFPGKNYLTNSSRMYARLEHEFDDETSAHLQLLSNIYNSHEPDRIASYTYYENELEAQYNFQPHPKHKLSVGTNLRWTYIDVGTVGNPNQFVFKHETYDEYWAGVYIMDNYEATDRLTLQGQFRTDWFSESHTDWSTRLSAIYSLDDMGHHTVWAGYSKAFRSPATLMRETSRTTAMGLINVLPPSEDLRNEQTWALEAGYNGQINENANFSLNTYYQRFDDLVGLRSSQLGPASFTQVDNVEGVDSWGAECELKIKQKWGTMTGWYAYNGFATDRKKQIIRALYPARHKAGLYGRFNLNDDWKLNAFYTYNDAITTYASPLIGAEAFNRLDINIARTFAEGNGEFMIGVYDVFNKTRGPFFDLSNMIAHETPGQTFFARLQYKF